jgi:hypothetical protein
MQRIFSRRSVVAGMGAVAALGATAGAAASAKKELIGRLQAEIAGA